MAYSKVGWKNDGEPAINAENLNKMDDQIFKNAEDIDNLKTKIKNTDLDFSIKSDNAVANKTISQGLANALTSEKSGSAVSFSDVSPIPHIVDVKLKNKDESLSGISGTEVKVYGKNLFNPSAWVNNKGTVTVNGANGVNCLNVSENVGSYYVVPGDNSLVYSFLIRIYRNSNYTKFSNITAMKPDGSTRSAAANIQLGERRKVKVYGGEKIYFDAFGQSDICVDLTYTQLILGDSVTVETEFEPYKEPVTYTANAEGTIENVESIYPSMTFLTNNSDVVVTAKCNKDLNKAFAELKSAIITLGGIN